MKKTLQSLLFFAVCAIAGTASACPTIDGLVDFNCDGEIKIAATGDSIVRGTGDKEGNFDNAGWVYDLRSIFPDARITNVGVPGVTSQSLRRLFIKNLVPGNITYREMRDADYVIIEVGTNEYWEFAPISRTITGIRRLRDTLRSFYEDTLHDPLPMFVIATPPQSKRSFQNPFLLKLAEALLQEKQSLNVKILFHKLGTSIISSDLLHPSKKGYDRMAQYVANVLRTKVTSQASALRPDLDADGIYDEFESSKFGSDPLLSDTDGDGISDGDEVFELATNPSSQDSDGDGALDLEDLSPNDPLIF